MAGSGFDVTRRDVRRRPRAFLLDRLADHLAQLRPVGMTVHGDSMLHGGFQSAAIETVQFFSLGYLRQSMNILAIAVPLFSATHRSCIECSRGESGQTAPSMELFRSSGI